MSKVRNLGPALDGEDREIRNTGNITLFFAVKRFCSLPDHQQHSVCRHTLLSSSLRPLNLSAFELRARDDVKEHVTRRIFFTLYPCPIFYNVSRPEYEPQMKRTELKR